MIHKNLDSRTVMPTWLNYALVRGNLPAFQLPGFVVPSCPNESKQLHDNTGNGPKHPPRRWHDSTSAKQPYTKSGPYKMLICSQVQHYTGKYFSKSPRCHTTVQQLVSTTTSYLVLKFWSTAADQVLCRPICTNHFNLTLCSAFYWI